MPRVSPLNSQVAFRSQASGGVFTIAGVRKVFTGPAETTCPPRCERSLCPAFQRFANLGLSLTVGGERIIDQGVYSAVVIMVMLTTLVTPPALKWSLGRARVPVGTAP